MERHCNNGSRHANKRRARLAADEPISTRCRNLNTSCSSRPSDSCRSPLARNHRQDQMRRHLGLVKDGLARRYSPSTFAESLRGIQVAIEMRKVAGTDFEPDAMPGQEDIADGPQVDREQIRLSRFH